MDVVNKADAVSLTIGDLVTQCYADGLGAIAINYVLRAYNLGKMHQIEDELKTRKTVDVVRAERT